MRGKVKWFNEKKGYGFISGDGQKDYFVHYSSIEGEGYRNLHEGQVVDFQVIDSVKGPQATDIKLVKL